MIKQYFKSFLELIYPNICIACFRERPCDQLPICIKCFNDLPRTNFHKKKDNPFTERFFGRIPLQRATAFLFFEKDTAVQRLIHALKYDDQPRVGFILGKNYGKKLRQEGVFDDLDLIVPVPLHPEKLRRRGYNQSEAFGRGLAEGLGKPFCNAVLERKKQSVSQTSMSRMERLKNVADAFHLTDEKAVARKHVLLVDDVMTTGATLEACGLQLLKAPDVRLSCVTLAIAEN